MAASLWIQILLVCTCVLGAAYAQKTLGYDGFNCASPGKKVVFACDTDCKREHNAAGGHCGNATLNDFTCKCDPPKSNLNLLSIQCVDQTNPAYKAICEADCLCNHGATESFCNFETRACECRGKATDMSLCPFPTRDEMIDFVIGKHAPGFPVGFDKVKEEFIFQAHLPNLLDMLVSRVKNDHEKVHNFIHGLLVR